MSRYFLAIPIPDDITKSLVGLQNGIEEAQWARPEKLHITLRFLGQIEEETAKKLQNSLKSLEHKKFEISLSSVGMFLENFQPAFLWAGVDGADFVKELKKKIDDNLKHYALPPENNADLEYVPHVTLAKIADPHKAEVVQFLEANKTYKSASFLVESFLLIRSEGNPSIPHTVYEEYGLASESQSASLNKKPRSSFPKP